MHTVLSTCKTNYKPTSNEIYKGTPVYTACDNTNMNESASENRSIANFPLPLLYTPYEKTEFNEKTKEICSKNLTVSNTLKICKIIILGDVCVGKTCIVNRFCHEIFDNKYKATIGVDFEVEKFNILNVPFNLQIWDTAGQERFKCIAQSYYRRAHVIVVVFDVSNIHSLSNCRTWIKEALETCGSFEPFKFLVATKSDLLSDMSNTIVEESGIKMAKAVHAEYWTVSAKTGRNIDKLFNRIAALVFDKIILNEYEEKMPKTIGNDLINIKTNKNTSKSKFDIISKVKSIKCDWF